MTTITGSGVTFANNPGHQPTMLDGLPLPNGRTVGTTESGELYRTFDRLKVPGFTHNLGRIAAIEKYAAEVARIHKAAGDAAVAAWLGANRV